MLMVVSRYEHAAREVIYSDNSHLFNSVLKGFLIVFLCGYGEYFIHGKTLQC